jgi:hypothetical protein
MVPELGEQIVPMVTLTRVRPDGSGTC